MKYHKSEVDYSQGKPHAHCGLCVHYRFHACEIVIGVILPEMWCNKFKKSLRSTIREATRGEYDAA